LTSLLAIQDDVAQLIGITVGDPKTGAVTKAELERMVADLICDSGHLAEERGFLSQRGQAGD
jgi:hypothetical protein